MKFKYRLSRLCLIFFAGYVLLFAMRLLYGYYAYPDGQPARTAALPSSSMDSGAVSKKNYAGSKYEVIGQQSTVDQKYEKVASIVSATASFADDEKKTRAAITEHNGIIQSENGRGVTGSRRLFLVVGVQPARFDAFCEVMKSVGTLRSMEVSKVDKTNEFLNLKAQRASLEKTRTALMDLRTQGGNIDELMKLQNRILEIEQQLQELGVSLGDFDEVNAFCTVKFTLAEYTTQVGSSLSIRHRVTVAMFWAAEIYAGLLALCCLTMLAAFLTLLAVDRFNILRRLLLTLESTKDT